MTEETSKEKEYIAYQGTKFTIEWFFDENGKSQSSEYFEELDLSGKAKFLSLLKWMGDTGQIRNEEIRFTPLSQNHTASCASFFKVER
jgi:hypothetical protein